MSDNSSVFELPYIMRFGDSTVCVYDANVHKMEIYETSKKNCILWKHIEFPPGFLLSSDGRLSFIYPLKEVFNWRNPLLWFLGVFKFYLCEVTNPKRTTAQELRQILKEQCNLSTSWASRFPKARRMNKYLLHQEPSKMITEEDFQNIYQSLRK